MGEDGCKHCRDGVPLLALGETTVRIERGRSLVLESYGATAMRRISRCPVCGAPTSRELGVMP